MSTQPSDQTVNHPGTLNTAAVTICSSSIHQQQGPPAFCLAPRTAFVLPPITNPVETAGPVLPPIIAPRSATALAVLPPQPPPRIVADPKQKTLGKGNHWTDKVQAGIKPTCSKFMTVWSERRHMKQAEYEKFYQERGQTPFYPWKSLIHNRGENIGNTGLVLYMDLRMHETNGIVSLVRGEPTVGFYGITSITVPQATRATFDAGFIPSATSLLALRDRYPTAHNDMLAVQKTWRTAGFT